MQENGVNLLTKWGTPSAHFDKGTKSFITLVLGILAGILFSKEKAEMVAINNIKRFRIWMGRLFFLFP
jgi:hypothetical protein